MHGGVMSCMYGLFAVWPTLFPLLCSVHHGCWTAGLPLRPQLFTGQVLLRGLWHLLRWRVSDRMGLHAGYRWSHAHCLLALFCQIRTKGAAVPHPFTHAVIVLWKMFLPSWPLSLTWARRHGETPASRLWGRCCLGSPTRHLTTNTVFLHLLCN